MDELCSKRAPSHVRRFQLERRIFQQLLDIKRMQIRAPRLTRLYASCCSQYRANKKNNSIRI